MVKYIAFALILMTAFADICRPDNFRIKDSGCGDDDYSYGLAYGMASYEDRIYIGVYWLEDNTDKDQFPAII